MLPIDLSGNSLVIANFHYLLLVASYPNLDLVTVT